MTTQLRFALILIVLGTGSLSFDGCDRVLAQNLAVSGRIIEHYRGDVYTVNAFVAENDVASADTSQPGNRFCRNVGMAFSFGSDSYLATLFCVTEFADSITVTSSGGEVFNATLVDAKKTSRISVVKIRDDADTRLPRITHVAPPPPGSDVYLLDLDQHTLTVNPATIDALPNEDGTFIIAAPGIAATSGTPVFDADARMIGLLAMQIEPTERLMPTASRDPSEMQNFLVVPADYVWVVAQSYLNVNEGECGWLGVAGDIVSAPDPEGVILRLVTENSPAAKAGLKVNDRIVSLNDSLITSYRYLIERLSSSRRGETVEVTIRRNGDTMVLPITLGAYPFR